jgi:cell division protein FtsB
MVNAVIGENGYLATVRARHTTEAIRADIARLRVENQRLLDQARRLKADPAALEEEARKDLGLIRPGETLVILRDAKPAPPATAPADPSGQGK